GSSDPGQVLTWSWTQHSGPAVTFTSPTTASPSFTAPDGPATLVFSVTVVDPLGLSSTDLVTVTVAAPLAVDAQLASAPNPGGSIGLSSTPTSDDDPADLTYAWVQTAGPTVAIATPDERDTTFAAPAAGTSVSFEVTVTDTLGQTASDTITITVNTPPTADAGDDQTVDPGDTVTLAGSGTDTETEDLDHQWTVASGPSVTLVDATSATATFTAPAGPATIVLELEVTDEHGLSATDTVTITVDGAPVVDAGDDQDVSPGSTVTLDGTDTADPEGGDLDLLWSQDSGPVVALVGSDTATPTFPAGAGPATFVFTLTATDERGNIGTDTVTITVDGTPTADAGDDQTVNPTTTVTLDGSGSTDPDGDALTYAWTQDAGPDVTLTGGETASPTFTAPAGPDDLTFTLTVTDEHGVSATDQVAVTVNGIPEASGGPAQTVDQGTTVALDATGSTDPDDDALTFSWAQESGPAVTLAGGDTATPSFTAPAGPASLVFLVTVTDVHGAEDTSAVVITVVPPLTPTEVWVVEVYSTFLHRVPDASGLNYWTVRLDSGTPRVTVVRSVALSSEATRGPVLTDLYDRLLDRTPGAGERDYWAGRLLAGTRFSWIERHLLASPERYAGSGGTDTTYVTDLYQRVLGRAGGEAEIAYWVDRLGSGAPRLATVDALLNTPEARAVRVAEVADAVLGRPATPSERADLGRAYAATRDPRTVAMAAFLLRA
ncbi:MAG TPA: DUF4214 domain-containing protein, partial [Iamia sp.]|nr:DUF4214 domain-containing protein [Iamia sp.]